MKAIKTKLGSILFILLMFIGSSAFAQLPAFNFSVGTTAQTCPGNGALAFTVSGIQPGAGVTYAVYLLPNTTNPITTTTSTTVPGLGAGNYTIIATQSLNGQTSTNTQNATINNLVVPLAYSLTFTRVRCGNDGTITVNVSSGNPTTYEILAGPVTKPPQASNMFTGLPIGLYSIRVYDTCGQAVVVSITVTQAFTGINIGPSDIVPVLPSCNEIGIEHNLALDPGLFVFTPLTVEYTVFPPGGGAPIVLTQTNVNGNLSQNIPFYNNQQYSYNVKITDACGNIFTRNNNIVNEKYDIGITGQLHGCEDNFFRLEPKFFMPPYTVTFTSFPPGFNPSALNINHPVFTADVVTYGGPDIGLYTPDGNYTISVTDACNRTVIVNFVIEDPEEGLPPQVTSNDALCGNNGVVNIKFEYVDVETVIITSGPPEYGPYPKDVSGYINENGVYIAEDLPPGSYTYVVTDECGNVHDVAQLISQGNSTDFNNLTIVQRPGCQPGYGSVKINNVLHLTNFVILAAPAAFTETLPYDASANIVPASGVFYMNSLPGGNYTIAATNECGLVITKDIIVNGYTITTNNFQVIPHCGSFDLNVQHVSNGTYIVGYFLQKYNPVTGGWEHPQTGLPYVEGTGLTPMNSIQLTNNSVNLSFGFTGEFRVMKTFYTFDNGTIANVRCLQELYTFSFDDAPKINDAYSFPCASGLTEVAIIADGVPPLTYNITSKEGLPFNVNNGQSNLFSGLESATYNFSVTDVCGNVRNILLDIDELNPVAIQAEGFCEGQDSKLFVQEFSFLEYKWYKEGTPATVLSTNGTLNFPAYESATDAGVYHLSITTDNPLSCMNQELTFSLLENANPDAGDDIAAGICNDGVSVDLKNFLAEGIQTTGEWEDTNNTGLLTNSTLTTQGLVAGVYQFKYTVYGLCNFTDEAILVLEVKDIPELPVVSNNEPLCVGSELQFTATAVPGAIYQWSGPDGFSSTEQSPLLSDITAAKAGTYSLTVTTNGCNSLAATLDVIVNPLPQAGDDAIVPLCNEGTIINLADYLSGADNGGTWEDVDASGSLSGSDFTTEGVAGGTYQFRYSVSNVCNDTDDAIISIQLKDIPQAPSLDEVAPICEGADIQLSAETIADAVYQWSGPDGFASNEQNPLIAQAGIAANGEYSVSVTVNGCASAQSVVPVIVNAFPQFDVEGNTVLCEGQSSSLTVVPDNFAVYKWYLNGNLLAETSATLSIVQTGDYEVEVDNNSCVTSREIPVEVNDNPFELVLDAGCVNYDYMLWVANLAEIPGAVVSWTGPANFSFTGAEANITNKPPGEYTATVTNSEGCTAVASITIDYTSCIIPKGVSPNGDGLNDFFDLSNLEVDELKIFNRYGLKVYEAQNYHKEWNGQSDKGTLPTGTYYYMITLSGGKQATGWVYLQRE